MHRARLFLLIGLTMAPAGGQALAATTFPGTVTLQWTAPGDDGMSGIAAVYDVRMSRQHITEANFESAVPLDLLITPAAPGTLQQVTMTGEIIPNTKYYLAMKTCDESGNWSSISNVAVYTLSEKSYRSVRAEVALGFSRPYPNPSRDQTRFNISLPSEAVVQVEAFDVLGRRVCTIAHGAYPAGPSKLVWDLRDDVGRRLEAGVYVVRAKLGDASFVRRIVVGM